MDKAQIIFILVLSTAVIFIFIAAIFYFLLQYRKRKLLHQQQTDKLHQLHAKELLNTQLEIQTQTMQYIGREIHDNVGQMLTLASLYTQQLEFENKAPQIASKIQGISKIINESLTELRLLSKSLTNDTINDNNIVELLQLESNKINDLKKCLVTFLCHQNNINLTYQTKSILLRIVQEFLQNSIKHACCKNIHIHLFTTQLDVTLFLQDDGKGFDINKIISNGIGLHNMKKRAELIGGTYHLQSTIGMGTTLTIKILL
jgi:signal transduction histidine kinase